jgi:hypothetical protein
VISGNHQLGAPTMLALSCSSGGQSTPTGLVITCGQMQIWWDHQVYGMYMDKDGLVGKNHETSNRRIHDTGMWTCRAGIIYPVMRSTKITMVTIQLLLGPTIQIYTAWYFKEHIVMHTLRSSNMATWQFYPRQRWMVSKLWTFINLHVYSACFDHFQ